LHPHPTHRYLNDRISRLNASHHMPCHQQQRYARDYCAESVAHDDGLREALKGWTGRNKHQKLALVVKILGDAGLFTVPSKGHTAVELSPWNTKGHTVDKLKDELKKWDVKLPLAGGNKKHDLVKKLMFYTDEEDVIDYSRLEGERLMLTESAVLHAAGVLEPEKAVWLVKDWVHWAANDQCRSVDVLKGRVSFLSSLKMKVPDKSTQDAVNEARKTVERIIKTLTPHAGAAHVTPVGAAVPYQDRKTPPPPDEVTLLQLPKRNPFIDSPLTDTELNPKNGLLRGPQITALRAVEDWAQRTSDRFEALATQSDVVVQVNRLMDDLFRKFRSLINGTYTGDPKAPSKASPDEGLDATFAKLEQLDSALKLITTEKATLYVIQLVL
jgi:hypothetical protein